ncbi:T9SS type A sorting domain-containing protein [uncultured Pontibacter sp.]|uniref:Ig-like domain-containing protein n=1 Tax=uncultured Pontibacter sp. TaxID=453356 RepID=UPI00261EE162|nr:T9SS type A sorting domain-containing protein [uncultured Pontibacter sp.]
MEKIFTKLILRPESTSLSKSYLISSLLLLFLLVGNVAWAQTPEIVPENACLGVPKTLTVTAKNVRAQWQYSTPPNAAFVNVGGITTTSAGALVSFTFTPTAQDNDRIYRVRFTNNGGQQESFSDTYFRIIVNQLPAAPQGIPAERCGAGAVELSASGAPEGGSYRWYVSNNATTPISNATESTYTTPSINATTTFYVSSVSSVGCESSSRTAVTATINSIPPPPTVANPTVTRCGLGEVTLSSAIVGGNNPTAGATNRWYSAATGGTVLGTGADYVAQLTDFNPLTVYVGSYNTTTGCESSQRVAVTARAIQTPVATVTPASPAAVCQGQTVQLTAQASPASPAVGTYTYQWFDSSGPITGATSATYSATASGSYSVAITPSGSTCASARSGAVQVTVSPQPTITVNAAPATICAGEATTLTASGADSYTWSPATGLSSTTGSTVTASPTTTTTYTVTAVSGGCTVTSLVTVTVNPLPAAVITQGANVVLCENGTVTLTAQQGAGYSYQWFEGGDEINNANTNTLIVDEDGEYTVQVTLNGCTVMSAVTTVTEQELPEVEIAAGSATTFCAGGSVVLTAGVDPATPDVGVYTYRWYEVGTPAATLGTASTLEVFASGTYTVEVTGNTCAVLADDPVTVTVNQLPAATITPGGPVDFCEGGLVILNAPDVPAGDDLAYAWSDGTNIIGTGQTLEVSTSGTFTLTVTNTITGCQNTSEPLSILVSTISEAAITYIEPTTFCEGGNIILSATEAPNGQTYSYKWLRDGNEIDGATTRVYTAQQSGDYSVSVTNNGCTKTSAEVTVTVVPQPTATITSGNDEACLVPGSTVSFDVEGTFTGEAAAWTTSDANFVITNPVYNTETGVATATVVVTGSGSATVSLTASSSVEGCADDVSAITLLVKPLPEATITFTGSTTVCTGESVLLTASEGVGYTYQWYLDGTIQNGSGNSFSASVSGNYTVIVSSNGCSVESAPVSVTVNPQPSASITASGPTVFCDGGSVTLTAVSDIGTGFVWFRNGTQVGTGATFVAKESGNYTVAVTVDATGCANLSAATIVTENPAPIVSVRTSGPTTICQGGTVTLIADVTPTGIAYNYSWYRDNELLATNTSNQYTVNQTGSYTVVVSNASTSCSTASAATVVTVTPNPVANAGAAQTVCAGQAIVLGVPAVAGYTYSWSPATGLSSTTVAQPTLTLPNGGATNIVATYTLRVTANNCSAESNVTITVTPTIANNTISNPNPTLCANTTASMLTGSTPTRGNGPYTYRWESSTVSATAGFGPATGINNTQNYSPGAVAQTTWYRRVVMSGGCAESISNAVVVPVTPITTLTLILTAAPFPVCPGQQTTYTATVLANVTSVTYPTNPRYEQVTWVGGTDVSNMFTFDWWKNDAVDNQGGQTGRTVSQAGLSSTDYFTVRARPNGQFNISCVAYVNRPEFTVQNDTKGNVLFSNRIYLGRPDNYNVTISRSPAGSICQGTPVTFTATPSAAFTNLTMEWVVTSSSGNVVSRTEFSSALQFSSSTLNNGDVVSLNFTSDENKCQPVAASNPITMVVVVPQTMAGGGAFCSGGTGGVPVSINGSQQGVTYQLRRTVNGTTVNVGQPVAGTGGVLSFGNQTIAGSYSVQPISENGACTLSYGPVVINETPAPVAYSVTGGGDYCINGGGVAVGLQNSQSGVNYQLFRTVNGSTSAVGSPVAGTGTAISFGNQEVAGTYTVVATTVANATTAACPQAMTGSATVEINPLPLVDLADVSACQGSQATVAANVSGGAGGYTYAWQVPAGWQGPTPTTPSFQTGVAGTYRLTVTDAENCASVVQDVVVTLTEIEELEDPLLRVEWTDGETKWEVTALESEVPDADFGASPTYVWYRRESIEVTSNGEWGQPVQSGPSNVYIEDAPAPNVQLKVEILNSSSCIRYVLTNIGVTPLPVEIIYLTTQKQGYNVVLEWATALEQNNAGFEIQVSEDGKAYRKIDYVATKNGNSNQKQVYKYVDSENGKHGTRYYRLKQMDVNGQFEYFGPKMVEFGSISDKIIVYPNPFENRLELNIEAEQEGTMQIILSNAIGRQLLQKTVLVEKGLNTEELLVEFNLPQGIYIVTTRMAGVTKHFKVLRK